MTNRAAIILAAGQGTRMKSSLPKVLHKVGGRAMLDWSIALARDVGCERIVVVANPQGQEVIDHVRSTLGETAVAIQDPPQGTGHAVSCAEAALEGFSGDIVVLYGDTPLVRPAAVEALFEALSDRVKVGVLGFEAANPGTYGRLIVNEAGDLDAIVEAKEASDEQLKITVCNSGVIAGDASTIFDLLKRVSNDNAKGEYYLTDIIGLAREQGARCRAVSCPEADVMGVDSRAALALAEGAFQTTRRGELLAGGVTMIAPETVYLSYDTVIENGVTLEPHIVFGCGVEIESGATIKGFSHLEGALVGSNCVIGPYARLRPGTVLDANAKIGNFVEVKNTRVGQGAKASHLSYLGDGDIGANANIGAGTIFCNYDGFLKHRTQIGAGAFIGSNTALVAPISVGDGAIIGSGSVITKDVDANALAVARGRQITRAGWATAFRDKMQAIKDTRRKTD